MLVVLATITLIIPNYTLATPGPIYSAAQLGFVSVVTIVLYAVFLYIQTVRHRDYFVRGVDDDDHGAPISGTALALSVVLLLLSLLSVVLLAKKFSDVVDVGAAAIGAPPAFAGVVVALLILLPEGVAAVSAAGRNDLQKSLNLALGSSLATIGLTVPAVAAVNIGLAKPLVLGLEGRDSVLLATDDHPVHADLRHRPHQHAVRLRSRGGVRGVHVPGARAVRPGSRRVTDC